MPLKDDEREALRAIIAQLPDDELEATRATAARVLRDLEDTSSAFPATQEFLRTRGLTNVRQLDKAGRRELEEHLRNSIRMLQKKMN